MIRIIGISVLIVLWLLAGLSYWIIRRKKHNHFILKQKEKLTYWFLDTIPIIFGISGLMVLLFVVI